MEGIDDVELQMDPSGLIPDVNAAANLASDLSAAGLISQTKLVAAVPGGGQPLNDYDPLWLIKAHPSCFPWGTGGPPEGMSLIRWIRGTINRYPREQFAQNVGFLTDSFNIWQRHETYTHASVQLKLSPHLAAQIQHLTEDDICAVLKLLAGGSNGKDYTKAFGALPPAARVLLDGLKRTGARVLGSPQSFLSLRSKVIAGNVIFGSYTCMMNLCPSEISSEWTFRLSGKEFNFDMFGNPANPRPVIESLRCVAANPKSCAHFAHAYMQSFAKVFLGWPMDSPCQIDPNCLFGQILMAYLKYEVSGRFAKHAHGQITQPALQAKHILLMMENGDFQKLLLNFMESFSMSYMPTPDLRQEPSSCECMGGRYADINIGTPWGSTHINDPLCFCIAAAAVCVRWDPDADVPQLAKDLGALARRIPLDSDVTSDDMLLNFICDMVHASGNMHAHTYTCEKGGRAGDHFDCRMGYDRLLVNLSHIAQQDGHPLMLLRRSHGQLVSFIPGLMLGCPSNHVMNLTCDASRWRRDFQLYLDDVASGNTEVSHMQCQGGKIIGPMLPSIKPSIMYPLQAVTPRLLGMAVYAAIQSEYSW